MAPYIFTESNGIHIIDLQKSVGKVDEAYKAVFNCKTIRSRIERLKTIEIMAEDGTFDVLPKKEVCLLEQAYVKDGDMAVGQYVASLAKANGEALSVKKFVRFETGEGIEKKQEDFAEEVAKQMAGN